MKSVHYFSLSPQQDIHPSISQSTCSTVLQIYQTLNRRNVVVVVATMSKEREQGPFTQAGIKSE